MKATADIKANDKYPFLRGRVTFYQTDKGVVVKAEVCNLPDTENNIFAFHIHDQNGHYNHDDLPHPKHRGDLPPLFSNNGYACMSVLADRFNLCEIEGKTVIIHEDRDDFTSQPSGNAGNQIACGVIKLLK